MTAYIQCCKCKHQWSLTGSSMNDPKCEKCGCQVVSISIGSKPDWWKEGKKDE